MREPEIIKEPEIIVEHSLQQNETTINTIKPEPVITYAFEQKAEESILPKPTYSVESNEDEDSVDGALNYMI